MAKYAGASVSNHIVVRERKESRPRKKKTEDSKNDMPPPNGHQTPPPADHADAQDSLLLWGLFKRLPKPQTPWPAEERKRWVDTLQNVLSLEYPDKE